MTTVSATSIYMIATSWSPGINELKHWIYCISTRGYKANVASYYVPRPKQAHWDNSSGTMTM